MKKDKFSLMPRSPKAASKPYRDVFAAPSGRKPAFMRALSAEEQRDVALAAGGR